MLSRHLSVTCCTETSVEHQNFYSPLLHEEPCKSALAPARVRTLPPSFHWTAKRAGSRKTLRKSPVLQSLRKEQVLTCESEVFFACTQLKELLRNSNIGIKFSRLSASPTESTCFVSVTAVFCLFSLRHGVWPPASEQRLRSLAQMQSLSPALLTVDS